MYVAALIINFGLRLKEEPTKLAGLWRSNLLHETVLYVTSCYFMYERNNFYLL